MLNISPFKQIIDFSIPKTCLCGEFLDNADLENSFLCSKCWDKINFNSGKSSCNICDYPLEHDFGEGTLCPSCIKEKPEYDQAQYCFRYDDVASTIINRVKYYDKTNYIPWLGRLAFSKIGNFNDEIDLITSVPINTKRMLRRKFNQSAAIANEVEKHIGRKLCNHNIIKRCKNIPNQTGLSRKQRLKNVKNAFEINNNLKSYIEGMNILLIDDVHTTGATISECSKVLKNSGVNKVFVLTVARTII